VGHSKFTATTQVAVPRKQLRLFGTPNLFGAGAALQVHSHDSKWRMPLASIPRSRGSNKSNSGSSEPRIHSGLVLHVNFTATTQSGECHWLAFLEVAVPRKFTDSLIKNSKLNIQNSKQNLW